GTANTYKSTFAFATESSRANARDLMSVRRDNPTPNQLPRISAKKEGHAKRALQICCLSASLCCFRVAGAIIRIEPLEKRSCSRVETERLQLLDVPISLLRIFVGIGF